MVPVIKSSRNQIRHMEAIRKVHRIKRIPTQLESFPHQKDKNNFENKIEEANELMKKYDGQQMKVRNNREFDAINKELELAHNLQDKIRKLVFSQEQISFMKAVMKIKQKNDTWDTMMPPLVSLKNINNNNNIKIIFKLLEEMENLSLNS